jgi:hypothetical protein
MLAFGKLGVATMILAASDVGQVWGRFDHQRPRFDLGHFLMWSFVAMAMAGITLFVLRKQRRDSRGFTSNSPRKLFGELCRAHGLAFSERRVLKQLAYFRNAAHPALLFVEPRYFDSATLPTALESKAQQLQRLQDRLFG